MNRQKEDRMCLRAPARTSETKIQSAIQIEAEKITTLYPYNVTSKSLFVISVHHLLGKYLCILFFLTFH